MRTVIYKNISGDELIRQSRRIVDQEEFLIPESEIVDWANDSLVLADISPDASRAQIGDGSQFFSEISDAINHLKGTVAFEVSVKNLSDTDADGHALIANAKPVGDCPAICSHNFCDPLSWFFDSIRVTGETLSLDSGTTYASSHVNWIDLTHGRYYGEDWLGGVYDPKIYIDGVEQTSGFTIDYENGKVTFESAPSGSVTADYSYENGSTYYLKPTAGKKLFIEHTEAQFSKNVQINKAVVFEVWGYNPSDLPNKMMYRRIKYKNGKDFMNTANKGHVIPAFSELQNDLIVFPYDYAKVTNLRSSQGLEIRLYIEDHQPYNGELGTVTFYTYEEDE